MELYTLSIQYKTSNFKISVCVFPLLLFHFYIFIQRSVFYLPVFVCLVFHAGSHFVTQDVFELMTILLSQPPLFWDYRSTLPYAMYPDVLIMSI